jgi:hypothetical protein
MQQLSFGCLVPHAEQSLFNQSSISGCDGPGPLTTRHLERQ